MKEEGEEEGCNRSDFKVRPPQGLPDAAYYGMACCGAEDVSLQNAEFKELLIQRGALDVSASSK